MSLVLRWTTAAKATSATLVIVKNDGEFCSVRQNATVPAVPWGPSDSDPGYCYHENGACIVFKEHNLAKDLKIHSREMA
jgi:hypothetical protein